MHRRVLAGVSVVVLALSLATTGCTRAHYRASADKEVYSILARKGARVPGMIKDFTIEPSPDALQRLCPPATGEQAAAGQRMVISIAQALELATYNSRSYQSQKESVYLSALSLTAARFRFFPQFFGTASGDYDDTGMGETDTVSARTGFGFDWLLKTGAALSVAVTSSFSKLISGNAPAASSSLFSAAITQPLLQGAGLAVTESLTQAERNVLYQIRSFVQFRRTFFVQILSDYYRVLENRQVLANQQDNYKALVFVRDRAQALSEAGQLSTLQVDQAQQDFLQAEDGVLRAEQNYQSSLDSFRVELGLPPETDLELDPAELDRLTAEKAEDLNFTEGQAVDLALAMRLDLMTANDQLGDAQRKVEVAANGLLPGLDVGMGISSSTAGPNNPTNFTTANTDFNAGFSLELPLNRLSQRNSYRSSLISLESSKRNQCQVRDGVVQDVRSTWRQFQRTNSSYRISVARVTLAARRVESTQMLLEAGRAIMRDVLDSQSSLLSAQNDLAGAIVDYRIARLDLAVNIDILFVSETGQLKESFDEYFRPQSQ